MTGPYRTPAQRIGRTLLIVYCTLVFAFLVLPTLAVIPISLNPSSFLVFPTEGLSLRWYRDLFDSPEWLRALRNSLAVATVTTILATALGTPAAIGLARMRSRAKPWLVGLFAAPMVVPVVVIAIAFYFLFAPMGLVNGFAGIVIAHTVLAIPFVVIVVHASLAGFDFELLRAASSLGARPVTVFFRVLAPLIGPGIAAGAVFAFMTSFDETVVALHRWLALTPSRMLAVALPDLVGDRRAINQPGTNDEYPNWRLPLSGPDGEPVDLDDIRASPLAESLFAALRGD